MPIISQIICDGCQAVKKQANHWYTLVIEENQQVVLRPMAMSPVELLKTDAAGIQYLCGRRCVAEALDRWMDRLTAPPWQPFQGEANEAVRRRPSDVAV
jgi:hypothetical protein